METVGVGDLQPAAPISGRLKRTHGTTKSHLPRAAMAVKVLVDGISFRLLLEFGIPFLLGDLTRASMHPTPGFTTTSRDWGPTSASCEMRAFALTCPLDCVCPVCPVRPVSPGG